MSLLVLPIVVFGTVSDAAPSPEEIVQSLQRRVEQVENLALEAVWSEYEDGRLVATVHQTIHRDSLERIRVRSESHREGKLLEWRDELYNGEITLIAVDDASRTRMGEPHTDETRARQERYRHAFVYDGLYAQSDPHRRRNPFTFGYAGIVGDITRVVAAGGKVEVTRRDEQGDVFELRYQMPGELDTFEREHVVVVDGGRGWIVLSHEQFFPDGKLGSRATYEYAAGSQGVWPPAAGRTQNWAQKDVSQPPLWEWAFRVDSIAVNDPAFDERVFEPSLRPDTYVVDLRYDTSYRVGAEGVINGQLTMLAQQARAEEEANLKRIEDAGAARRELDARWRLGAGLRIALIAINVALAAVLGFLWWFRRRART